MSDEALNAAASAESLNRAMEAGYERLKREIRYNATYFKRMVEELGGVRQRRSSEAVDARANSTPRAVADWGCAA